MAVVASLTAATTKGDASASEAQLHKIVEVVRAAGPAALSAADGWRNHILWVDDRPENNTYERQAFETMGLYFTLALSTDKAFERLSQAKYAAIISDMGRREGPREGYVLLDRLRKEGDRTPLFFYASSNAPEHKRETSDHGGQGCTNNARSLRDGHQGGHPEANRVMANKQLKQTTTPHYARNVRSITAGPLARSSELRCDAACRLAPLLP